MDRTLDAVDASTEDMQEIFKAVLSVPYQAAVAALESSFTRVVETAQEHLTLLPAERLTATLLSLSLLEARYRDHYQHAQEST
jgi:inner membrane protein involved in colicin E2 resistance